MQKLNTKDLILKNSINIIYKYGFVKASIREIVKSVGVTNAAVYNHFKNKDEILYTIINNVGEFLMRELLAVIEVYDDPVECLREMIFTQVCLLPKKRKEVKIYMEEQYQLSKPLQNKAKKQQRKIFDLYNKKIYELKEAGLLGEIPCEEISLSIFATMLWPIRWYSEKGKFSIEEIAEHTIEFLFSGILKKNVSLTDIESDGIIQDFNNP